MGVWDYASAVKKQTKFTRRQLNFLSPNHNRNHRMKQVQKKIKFWIKKNPKKIKSSCYKRIFHQNILK